MEMKTELFFAVVAVTCGTFFGIIIGDIGFGFLSGIVMVVILSPIGFAWDTFQKQAYKESEGEKE